MKRALLFFICVSCLLFPAGAWAKWKDYQKGEDAYNAQQYAEAIKNYKEFLKDAEHDKDYQDVTQAAQFKLYEMYRDAKGTERNIDLATNYLNQVANGPIESWRNNGLFELGQLYSGGYGIFKEDKAKAERYFKVCAESGFDPCKTPLDSPVNVLEKADQLYATSDYGAAASLYKQVIEKAKKSEKYADFLQMTQLKLYEMYRDGKGVQQNLNTAIEYLKNAEKGKDITWAGHAAYELGSLYLGEYGYAEADIPAAGKYLGKCAKAGNEACRTLIDTIKDNPEIYISLHENEFEQEKNTEAPAGYDYAVDLVKKGEFEKAFPVLLWHARQGHEQAQLAVSYYYKDAPEGVRDLNLYRAWLLKSAKSGNRTAQYELGLMYRYDPSTSLRGDKDSEEWLLKAAKQGETEALNDLAIIKLHPYDAGVKPNFVSALKYFQQAAERGSLKALVNLGDMYLEGFGVEKSQESAKQYYMKSADGGLLLARTRLYEKFNIVYNGQKSKSSGVMDTLGSWWSAPKKQPEEKATDKPIEKIESAEIKEAQAVLSDQSISSPKKLSAIEIYAKASPSVMKILALKTEGDSIDWDSSALGSAVAVSADTAITNCHVLAGMQIFVAEIKDKPVFFTLSKADADKDICVIKAKEPILVPLAETKPYKDLLVGERVYAIGSPNGLDNTLSDGLISGIRDKGATKIIQLSVPITHGSSGGALLDEEGRLIGITTAGMEGAGNINFAVAIDEAMDLLAGAH